MKVGAAEQLVRIVVDSAQLEGDLSLPEDATGGGAVRPWQRQQPA